MRTGRRLGMILHTKNRFGLVPHAFDRLVVQVDAIDGDVGRQSSWVHGETVVLRSDFHPAGLLVFHRLIGAAMAELQFEGFAAKGLA